MGGVPVAQRASLADVFENHPSIAPSWRLELFSLIRQTPHLDWLLLTKRPENIRNLLLQAGSVAARHNGYMGSDDDFVATRLWLNAWLDGRPPANAWLGTTVEDRKRAVQRIPWLLGTHAVVHFLSMEPLIELVDLRHLEMVKPEPPHGPGVWLDALTGVYAGPDDAGAKVDWVIVGGESGAKARLFDADWARTIVLQCRAAGAVPFVKQLGSNPHDDGRPIDLKDHHGGDWDEWPADLEHREFPEAR